MVHESSEHEGFLDTALRQDDMDVGTFSTLSGDECDPYLLLEAMEGEDTGDLQRKDLVDAD